METEIHLEVIEMDRILKDPNILALARNLTLHSDSGMNRALNLYQVLSQTRSVKAKGIFAYYGTSLAKAVGWILVTQECDAMYFSGQQIGTACIQVYVAEEYRRQHIGTKLINKATEIINAESFCVYAGDNLNFFAPFMALTNFQRVGYSHRI